MSWLSRARMASETIGDTFVAWSISLEELERRAEIREQHDAARIRARRLRAAWARTRRAK